MTDLHRDLEREVKIWVERQFNFIQLEVVNGFCQANNMELVEYIRNKEVKDVIVDWISDVSDDTALIQEFLEQSDDMDGVSTFDYENAKGGIKDSFITAYGSDKWSEFVDFLCTEKEDEIQDYIYEQENYPLWDTLFEYRDEPTEEELVNALNLNLGVVEGIDPFNPMLFMMSGGHSFYSSYWIPLYLSRFADAREKYSGVDYSML